jgi:hypothetical protein
MSRHAGVETKVKTGPDLFLFLAGHPHTPALFRTRVFSPRTVTLPQIAALYCFFFFWLVSRATTFAPNGPLESVW